jgi:16S rRNA (guanine966-N2)-methyltransferase
MKARRKHGSKPGKVRIIGGDWRRRWLPVAGVESLRPTPDRVRETLFSWLTPLLPGARCLDLFAGTGVLGFEALSRGAGEVVFVDSSPIVVRALEAARERLAATADIVRADAAEYLQRAELAPFDIVFVDPPYTLSVERLFQDLPARLYPNARVYLERERDDRWPEPLGFDWICRATAGAVAFGLAVPSAPIGV